MPSPGREPAFVDAAGHVSGQRLVGPDEHRLIVEQNAAQQPDGRCIGNCVGVVGVVAISRGQGRAGHLVQAHEQFRRVAGRQQFFDKAVDFRVAKLVDLLERLFLFVQTLAQRPRGVGMVEQVPAGFQLDLKLGNRQCPSPHGLGQPPLEIKKPQQPPGVLGHRKLAPKLPVVAGKTIGKRRPSGSGRPAGLGPADRWDLVAGLGAAELPPVDSSWFMSALAKNNNRGMRFLP